MLKQLSWRSSKDIFLMYYFSLPDQGGKNKIYQFLGFFVKILTETGGLSFYGSHKGGGPGEMQR